MRQQRSMGVGLGLALLSAITFSTSGTFARSLIEAGWSAEAAVATRVGVASLLLEYLGIILVVGWMWVVHGQRPRRLTVAGSVAALLGLVFVLDLAGGGRLDPIGVLWGLAAGVGLAAYFVLSAGGDGDLPATAMASGGMATGAGILLALGGIGVLPLHVTFGEVQFAGHRTSWLVPIVGLSAVAAVIPY